MDTSTRRTPSAPATRERLLVEWRAARRRREAAPLGSDSYREACDEIARIEVDIARLERAMDPPRV
ncbi:MAG TPA: hypothetical protein VKA85_02945 [Candidatus Limnocylindrales bacterium]|nr:hypothetical protein [Candidatus Limnocylindrales bacterium]